MGIEAAKALIMSAAGIALLLRRVRTPGPWRLLFAIACLVFAGGILGHILHRSTIEDVGKGAGAVMFILAALSMALWPAVRSKNRMD